MPIFFAVLTTSSTPAARITLKAGTFRELPRALRMDDGAVIVAGRVARA